MQYLLPEMHRTNGYYIFDIQAVHIDGLKKILCSIASDFRLCRTKLPTKIHYTSM